MMKIILAGGTGQLGRRLARALDQDGHEVVVLSRKGSCDGKVVEWDGRTVGPWAQEVNGADAVINLAGRSVNCRYSKANLQEMLDSRVESTRAVGLAIEQAGRPPRIWLQMSTATIYAHRLDGTNDEANGWIGGDEPEVPRRWRASIDIARAWEGALREANTPNTRRVSLRTAMVMSPDRGGTLDILLNLTRWGLGGSIAGGNQYMSWIHDHDFVRAMRFLLDRDDLEGPINIAALGPLTQRNFMAALRAASGARIALPATRWMVELGTFFLRTESELILKSRNVVPGRLLGAGFSFEFPEWPSAADDLVTRWRSRRSQSQSHRRVAS
jgi:uncharacterized protein (TIGR01777 family)